MTITADLVIIELINELIEKRNSDNDISEKYLKLSSQIDCLKELCEDAKRFDILENLTD